MSIVYNNTEIDIIKYNGNSIDAINYNNTEVYVSTRTLTVNIGDYISSIIINGTTYTSNTTLTIKPGTTVTLNCNVNSNTTSNNITTTYSFVNWTGYTTNTNQSFTFTMPNSNITYTANGKIASQTFSWPSSGNISESTFLTGINNGSYNTSLVGRYVTLTEGSSTHDWLIVRVNSNSYDLWYKGTIGRGCFKGEGTNRYWTNNDPTDTKYARGLCTSYESKLSSSIRTKLKTGLNANCGRDVVVILSARQLGYTSPGAFNDPGTILEASDSTSNTAIPYFNDNNRSIGSAYWTSSAYTDYSLSMWYVDDNNGKFYNTSYDYTFQVNPAIRVG